MHKFGLTFALPEPGAADVTTRELTITVSGQDTPIVQKLAGVAKESDQAIFDKDAELSVTLVDIDDSGNRSPASAAFVYKVIDDIAPPAPGQLGVASKVEIPDAPPAPPAGSNP